MFQAYRYYSHLLPAPPGGLAPELFYAPVFLAALFCIAAPLYKLFLLQFMPETLRFESVDVQRVPRLDNVALSHHSEQFGQLGFVWLGDITNTSGIAAFNPPPVASGANVSAPIPPVPTIGRIENSFELVPGFCRVFAHPQHGCLAEAYQHFPPGAPNPPLKITVSSLLQDGWDLTTSNRKPEAIPYIMRRPRGARTTHPNVGADELLRAHLETRQKFQSERGLSVVPLGHLEDFVEQERRAMREYKAALKARNPFGALWEALTFHLSPKREWLGVWPQQP